MSDDLSKKMKEILRQEDQSGYVIDRVAGEVSDENQPDENVDVEGEKMTNEEKRESPMKKTSMKMKKPKEVEKGDSGDDEGVKEGNKEESGTRATVVSFDMSGEEYAEVLDKKKKEVDASPSSSKDAIDARELQESARRTYASFHTPYMRLSLVSGTTDLKTKLAEAGSNLVVIDFFATWCGPCKMISPKVEELAKENPDVVFLKVDIDECDDIATEYEVQSMPTFIFIKNSAKIDGFSGANYDKLKETVLKLK